MNGSDVPVRHRVNNGAPGIEAQSGKGHGSLEAVP